MTLYLQLFLAFFKIGLFGFGGGYGILPLIYQSVLEFGFMDASEFSRLVALSQVTPGPIAVNAATYVGYQCAGVGGALAATFGVALPSLFLVLLVYHFLTKFKTNTTLNSVLSGIRPATVGLLASAVIYLSVGSLFPEGTTALSLLQDPLGHINWLPVVFFVIVAVLSGWVKISPIKLTLLAGLVGAFVIR